MAAPQYIDIIFDPETGETEIKIEGFADTVCDELAKKIIAQMGVTNAKVTKTASAEGGDGQKRTQSIG
jgi:hypothetical protein